MFDSLFFILYTLYFGFRMYLMYYADEGGNRVYSLKKSCPSGSATKSAHPARFSPDDKFSRHRVTLKKRFNVLLTQTTARPL